MQTTILVGMKLELVPATSAATPASDHVQTRAHEFHGVRTARAFKRLQLITDLHPLTIAKYLAGLPVQRSNAEKVQAAIEHLRKDGLVSP